MLQIHVDWSTFRGLALLLVVREHSYNGERYGNTSQSDSEERGRRTFTGNLKQISQGIGDDQTLALRRVHFARVIISVTALAFLQRKVTLKCNLHCY